MPHYHAPRAKSFIQAFESRVERVPFMSCWMWIGNADKRGYGKIYFNGKGATAHRAIYIHLHGEQPAGNEIDHLCRNPWCVNPDHLESVTKYENIMRGFGFAAINASKKSCKYGHPYSGDNLFVASRGGRGCRMCEKERRLRQNAARRERYRAAKREGTC